MSSATGLTQVVVVDAGMLRVQLRNINPLNYGSKPEQESSSPRERTRVTGKHQSCCAQGWMQPGLGDHQSSMEAKIVWKVGSQGVEPARRRRFIQCKPAAAAQKHSSRQILNFHLRFSIFYVYPCVPSILNVGLPSAAAVRHRSSAVTDCYPYIARLFSLISAHNDGRWHVNKQHISKALGWCNTWGNSCTSPGVIVSDDGDAWK